MLERADQEPGTHDITLDKDFYDALDKGGGVRQKLPQDPDKCLDLVRSYHPNIVYLCHNARTVHLQSPSGPRTIFKVFGSPYVPRRDEWAFGYTRHDDAAEHLWSDIPLDTDILLTHTPAFNHRNASTEWQAAGCEVLRRALWQVRPRLAVCGRIHEARGIEKVHWELGQTYPPFWERWTTQINVPSSWGKGRWMTLDMTCMGDNPLLNDGASFDPRLDGGVPGQQPHGNNVSFSPGREQSDTALLRILEDNDGDPPSEVLTMMSGSSDMTAQTGVPQWNTAEVTYRHEAALPPQPMRPILGDRNQAALQVRLGRQETLIVNASIKTKGITKRVYNKPIVVDIELPVGY
ncbi:unnamed protein product, partial [Aureobasidium uvarum]